MKHAFENEAAMSSNSNPGKRIGQLIHRFINDERGFITLEFAIVAPFLFATWLGMVVIMDTENATTRVGKVTSTVADIIAQSPNVNGEYVNAAFDAGKAMMGNIAEANLKIYVAGIEINNDQTIDVKWICGRHFSEEGMDSAVDELDLPAQLKQTPGFIVVSYGEYTHTPIFSSGSHTYEYRNYFVPRHSLETLSEGCDA